MRSVVTGVALLSMSAVATSKCALEIHSVRGVATTSNGAPVSNAKITATWGTKLKPEVVVTQSDVAGTFTISVAFDPFSGLSMLGDRCEAKLGSIVVMATSDGHLKARQEVSASKFDTELKLVLR
jgi:hypothetical protein